MNRNSTHVSRLPRAPSWHGWGFALIIGGLAGCGQSGQVNEIPEAAKKSLIQKKVDVQPRRSPPAKGVRP